MAAEIITYNSQDIMSEYDTYYAEDYRAWGQVYPAMAQDLRFYLGDQWYGSEVDALREEGRQRFTINKTKAKIDWICGYEVQNRLSPIVLPVQGGSQETADQFTKGALYVFDSSHGYRQCSDSFGAGNKTGWTLLNAYLDYSSDPVNGDICFGRDPYSGFIMSAYFTKVDLSDCDHVIKRKYITPSVAAALLPEQEDEVMSLARDGWERDNKFTWMVFQRVPTGQRMMAYNEFYRQKYQPQKVILNKMTMNYVDWDGDRETMEYLQSLAADQGHDLEVISRKKRFIEKHIILNNNYMRTEINPYGIDEYPFSFYSPVFEPESEEYTFKVQSLVRQLIDPARERNRRRSQLIDVVESQLNSGWIEEDGAVKNPKMLYQSGQGRRIVLNKGFKRDAIDRIQPAVIPASYFQEIDMTDKDEMEILGMNPTSFGNEDSKQVSALVELQRQKAGMMALENVFDYYSQFKANLTRKVIKMMQNWSKDKLTKILGEEPTEQFFEKDMTKYHVTVAEGIYTPTQRYMLFRQVAELKQLGEPVPPGELTKLSPLQGSSEHRQAVEEYAKQQEQQAQQLQQSEMAQAQSLQQSLDAKSISDLALSKERQARAISNLGLEDERVAKAVEDRENALLVRIKALEEMSKLQTAHKADKDNRLMDMVRFAQEYENHIQQREHAEKQMNMAQVESMTQPKPNEVKQPNQPKE
jgi:hypothetical protein